MRRLISIALFMALGTVGPLQAAVPAKITLETAEEKGCLSCHEGIESIREETSAMLAAIRALGQSQGDPEGCVICHGGNPRGLTAEEAHQGVPEKVSKTGPKTFYPDPGSIWIADNTCGQSGCHQGYPYRLERALMSTEAGKI